jgi:hypothetical protein
MVFWIRSKPAEVEANRRERLSEPDEHYDRDYERIAQVSALKHQWLLPDGTLAQGLTTTPTA